MPAMADGGGQRGVYGRAESPYNIECSTTAFASGSSNGTRTSILASFASFGFAGETVSSGRSPASNNALVGYSPSRGVIPIRYEDMIEAVRIRTDTLYDIPGCEVAVQALEAARKKDLEDWMDENNFDCIVFPTNGDVASADAEEKLRSMMHALQDGIKYANGGSALKRLGIPAITAPVGTLHEIGMPVGITFCGKGWGDNKLLSYVYAYENVTKSADIPAFDTRSSVRQDKDGL